jgi:Domain of unknown function (DUF4136)
MKTWVRMLVVIAMLAHGGCAGTVAHHDFDPAVDFDHYKTFSWISEHPLVLSSGLNAALEGRIQQSARDLLTAKGFRFVETAPQADFVVGFGVGASDKSRIEAYPVAYTGRWTWRAHGARDTSARQQVEGRLVVDIFDVRSHRPVWHGWSTKALAGDADAAAIREALTAILAHFPPG